jgi:outer membrane lipoprotein-sorting protein
MTKGKDNIFMKHIFVFLLALIFATPAYAMVDNPYVTQAQNWLRNLDSAQSRFEQVAHNGTSMRGTFYIDRPGRLRFEYDAPTRDFIVADGFQIHFYDAEADQYNSAPIGQTLADFILRDKVDFKKDVTIESVMESQDHVHITVFQTDQEGMGTLTLNFSKAPFALQSWDIVDAQGLRTSVILRDFDRTATINPSIFTVDNRNLNE